MKRYSLELMGIWGKFRFLVVCLPAMAYGQDAPAPHRPDCGFERRLHTSAARPDVGAPLPLYSRVNL